MFSKQKFARFQQQLNDLSTMGSLQQSQFSTQWSPDSLVVVYNRVGQVFIGSAYINAYWNLEIYLKSADRSLFSEKSADTSQKVLMFFLFHSFAGTQNGQYDIHGRCGI